MVRTLDHETKQLASKVSNSKHSAQVDRVSQNNLPFDYGGEGGRGRAVRSSMQKNWIDAHRGPNCHNGQTKDLVNDHRKDPPRPDKRNFESLNADLL